MKKNFPSYALVGLLGVLLLTGCQWFASPAQPTQPAPEEIVSDDSDLTTSDSPVTLAEQARYDDYTETRYYELLGRQPFALFFHAPWCPTCRSMEKDILKNLSGAPGEVVILKADYDTEAALKEKYGIRTQSTVVLINKDGEAVETLAAPSFEKIRERLTSI